MAQFLGMEAKGAEALRVGLRKIVKETEAARRAAQEARSRLVYDESDPASVARYRDQWRRFVDERARIASGLDGLLDSSPRSKLFRAHAARWIHFLEDHPDPHPAPEQQK